MASPRSRSSTSSVARILANSSATPVTATSTSARSIGPRSCSADSSRWPATSRPTRTATENGSGSATPASTSAPPVVAAVRRRAGDHAADVVLDHDAPPEMVGEDLGDAGRAARRGAPARRAAAGRSSDRLSSRVRLGQHASQMDLVLVPPGVVDGDRGMPGERGQEVGVLRRRTGGRPAWRAGSARRSPRPGRCSGAQMTDTEVVSVERAGAVRVGRVVVHPDRCAGQDRLGRQPLAERHLEPERAPSAAGTRPRPAGDRARAPRAACRRCPRRAGRAHPRRSPSRTVRGRATR